MPGLKRLKSITSAVFICTLYKLHDPLHIYSAGGDIMEINELINLVVNNGFPVAVSCYLLIRLEKQLSSLSASINKLNTIISTKLGVVIDSDNNSESVA